MEKKKILITGASKGLGLAISKKLSADYTLILHASKPESFTHIEPGSHLLCADFSDNDQVANFCKQLKKEHGNDLYAVINNAGVTHDKPLNFQPDREIDAMLNVNLRAPIMICKNGHENFFTEQYRRNYQYQLGSWRERQRFINRCMQQQKRVWRRYRGRWRRRLRLLNETHSIRVLSVSPGFVETDMTASIPQAIKDKYLSMIPAKRFGKVDDIADTIVFLLSEKSIVY